MANEFKFLVKNVSSSIGFYHLNGVEYTLEPRSWVRLSQKPQIMTAELKVVEI